MLSDLIIEWVSVTRTPFFKWDLVDWAFIAGILSLAGTILTFVLVLLDVVFLSLRKSRLTRLKQQLKAFFLQSSDGSPGIPKKILPRSFSLFAELWLSHYKKGPVIERQQLIKIAHISGLRELAILQLRQTSVNHSLVLAINILGLLNERDFFREILPFLSRDNPGISFIAARALARTDPIKAAPLILKRLALNPDWPANHVGPMFRTMGPLALTDAYLNLLPSLICSRDDAPLAQYLRYIDRKKMEEVIQLTKNSKFLYLWEASCLAFMDDPKDLQTVLYGMSSPDPGVKCAAIHAFSRLKAPSDASHLCSLLDDDAWRVRTLAAETIVSMFKHDWVVIDRFIELSLLSANRTTLLQELRPEMPQ